MALGDTTELLSDIRERGSIPPGDLRFTDVKLLAAATKELREGCAPLLHQAKSEHLVTPYNVAVVSGTSTYRVPPRAIGGGGLRDAVFQDTAGTRVSLRQVAVEELPDWGTATGTPFGYYLRGYNVELVPTPNVAGTLLLPYYARPNALVATGDAFVMSGGGSLVSGNTVFSGTNADVIAPGERVDVIRGNPCFETLAANVMVVDQVASTVELEGNVVLDTASGDFIVATGFSPVVQLPVEMLGLLATRTARRALKSAGDDKWQALDADVAELEATARTWLSPRNDGEVASVSPLWTGLYGGVLTGWR